MIPTSLPPALKQAIADRFEGVSRTSLAESAARLSRAYRAGFASNEALASSRDLDAYLAVRLPATYAAICRALDYTAELMGPLPLRSLLDAGCGPGTAAHAALGVFPDIAGVTLIDSHPELLTLARDLGRAAGVAPLASAVLIHRDLTRAFDASDTGKLRSDLVVAGYVLAELAEKDAARLAARLWSLADRLMVIVEPGTPAGFARIRAARECLIALGGHIVAPCPGGGACPLVEPDWCHFKVRVQRSRDHMRVKGADLPYEDEPFSYVAVVRDPAFAAPAAARVLGPPTRTKAGTALTLCTAAGREERFVPARDGAATRALKRVGWGEALTLS